MGLFGQMKAINRLEDRCKRLETQHDDTERTIRKLDLEFGDLYDKVKRQMSRMSKRAALDAKENGALVTDVDTGEESQIDPISRSILARRGGFRRQAE